MILQEGVPTYERVNDAVAEPVVYMIDRYVVGGFYRVQRRARHRREPERARARASCRWPSPRANQLPRPGAKPGASAPNRFYMYGVIAPPGHAGGELRAGSDRPGRRDLRVGGGRRHRVAALQHGLTAVTAAHNGALSTNEPDRGRSPRHRYHVSQPSSKSSLAALTLGAIGVVYGDIGTSPLYALKEVFAHGHVPLTPGQHLRHAVAGVLDADGRSSR